MGLSQAPKGKGKHMEACLLLQHLNSAHVIKMKGTAKYCASCLAHGYVDETVFIPTKLNSADINDLGMKVSIVSLFAAFQVATKRYLDNTTSLFETSK